MNSGGVMTKVEEVIDYINTIELRPERIEALLQRQPDGQIVIFPCLMDYSQDPRDKFKTKVMIRAHRAMTNVDPYL